MSSFDCEATHFVESREKVSGRDSNVRDVRCRDRRGHEKFDNVGEVLDLFSSF